MNPKDLILAGLAPSKGALHSPVQVQKLFFLIDKNIPDEIGGPVFNFTPYNYGPFDKAVYTNLRELETEGLVDVEIRGGYHCYRLTIDGQVRALELFSQFPKYVQNYLSEASEFVRKLSFTELVSAIYRAYPEMKANSVFQE
jgi:DNA-binding PadR family transcriptional regulator